MAGDPCSKPRCALVSGHPGPCYWPPSAAWDDRDAEVARLRSQRAALLDALRRAADALHDEGAYAEENRARAAIRAAEGET